MSSLRSSGAHVMTAMVTLALAMLWVGARDSRRREAATTSSPSPPPAALAASPIPEEVLKASDADEQINIRVYANTNRGVVNITTAASSVGMFGDESTTGGSGSGFAIDRDGHILTNYHVIEGADTVQATLADGSAHEAKIVGADASNDVAVIKVDLPPDQLVAAEPGRLVGALWSARRCWPWATRSAWSGP